MPDGLLEGKIQRLKLCTCITLYGTESANLNCMCIVYLYVLTVMCVAMCTL